MTDAIEQFKESQYVVVVGLANPDHLEGLMRIASVFARRQRGRIIAASVILVPDSVELVDAPERAEAEAVARAEAMIQRAVDFGAELGLQVDPVLEFAHEVASGLVAVAHEQQAQIMLVGFSPPAQPSPETGEGPARISEAIAGLALCSLAIVAFPGDDADTTRMLIPVTETFEPGMIKDLAKVFSIFGGALITFVGLLPRDLPAEEFEQRADGLRAKIEEMDLAEVEALRLRGPAAEACLFGAEAQQMAGENAQAAFILRARL